MLSSARTGASMALRGELPKSTNNPPATTTTMLINCLPARPTTTHLLPFRAAAAALSSSARAPAASPNAVLPHGGYGIANRERKEVPLPSQEGTKGVVQYAL